MSKNNEKIINLFWSRRLSAALKKYKVKTIKTHQFVKGITDDASRKEYAQFVLDEVLKGIGDDIPKEMIRAFLDEKHYYAEDDIHINVELSCEKDILYDYGPACLDRDLSPIYEKEAAGVFWDSPCFRMHIYGSAVVSCAITYGKDWWFVARKELYCGEPQKIGKVLADLFKTRYEDVEQCKKEIAKTEKVQRLVVSSFKSLIESHLRGSELQWAVSEGNNGKIQVHIKFTPKKIITMVIETASFENKYKQVLDFIDQLDTLIRKENIDITVGGESYDQEIEWQNTEEGTSR